MSNKITIVIPTKDRFEKLNNCLNSLYKSSFKQFQIIVIDDCSSKEYVEKVRSVHGRNISLIQNSKSLGVGLCRSKGAKKANTKYVLFVDDDNIVDKFMLERLYETMEKDPDICIVMPIMYFKEDKKIIFYSGIITSLVTTYLKIIPLDTIVKRPYTDLSINTAPNLFMVRRKQGDKIKWFDKFLRGVYTDLDYFLRLKKIYPNTYIAINPKAKCWHDTPVLIRGYRNETYKNKDRMYLLGRNRGIIMKRYAKTWSLTFFSIFLYPVFTIYYLNKIMRGGSRDSLTSFIKGTLDGYRYIFYKN